jgi:hypothetical protein
MPGPFRMPFMFNSDWIFSLWGKLGGSLRDWKMYPSIITFIDTKYKNMNKIITLAAELAFFSGP